VTFASRTHQHRRSILFLFAMLSATGLAVALKLPTALFPEVNFPRIVVALEASDQPAERMATEITQVVEEAVRSVPGVRNIRSTTTRGAADISINFDWSEDMNTAVLQVESAVNEIVSDLPAGTAFEVRRMDPTVFPALCYSLTSDTVPMTKLRDLAQYELRPVLSTIAGVAKVTVLGGDVAEYRIETDPVRLTAHGMSMEQVSEAVADANVLTSTGRLEDHNILYLIISTSLLKDKAAIESVVIKADAAGVVRVGDVATVYPSAEPQWIRVTADGHDAVLLQIHQQRSGNTVQIANDITSRIEMLKTKLPKGVRIANWYDQSELISLSAKSVRDAVVVGVVLSFLLLLVFLRNFKITLIAAIVVPSVLAVTILFLDLFHQSFNIMTLGGMAAAVGLIIDDAIVMIEHIVRRLRTGKGSATDRIHIAVSELMHPLIGSSLSTVIIFAPLTFLTGVTGAFFKALSLTMAVSLAVSFLVTWFAVPLLADRLLTDRDTKLNDRGRLFSLIARAYSSVMTGLLVHPWRILLIILPLMAGGIVAYQRTGSGFMPKMDEGGFVLDYVASPGTSLSETDRLVRQVEAVLRSTPEVETYSRRTGAQLGGMITEASEGDFFVRLKPPPRRDIEEIMDEVRTKIERTVPGLEVELILLMEDLIGDLTAVPQPIEVKLYSDDHEILTETAKKVADLVDRVPGVVEVKDGLVPAGDALEIVVDQRKAALEGMNPEAVTAVLSDLLDGRVTTKVQRGPKMVGLRVWTKQVLRGNDQVILDLPIETPDGRIFPLRRVATITRIIGQPQIMRDDLRRTIAVTGRITGRDMGTTVNDIIRILDKPGVIPTSVTYRMGGLYEQQQIAFQGLVQVLIAAVLLVFLLLLFLYEQFRTAGAILLTTLLALPAVFIGLQITDTELNITAMMGMTMVVGIVTEVGIFFYSEYLEPTDIADTADRLIQAGINRMRPIAMTTLAAILALSPLALGIGQGSAMQRPLAIAIIAGLAVQPFLSLVVLPVLLFVAQAKSVSQTANRC
jgi:CzcA family heavy metal efflux pump